LLLEQFVMDQQREGKQLHRYRSRIATLKKTLVSVRWLLVPLMHGGDPKAEKAIAIIDKALERDMQVISRRHARPEGGKTS
jgi:hypothetical protein